MMTEMGSPQSCAVVGSPVSHSLSPAMHRAAYRELGLPWTYEAIDLAEGSLADFADRLDPTWRGLSVTMPLKREAALLAHRRSEDVSFLAVANTLVRESDGWSAANTDVSGAMNAWLASGVSQVRSLRFLGAGATVASLALAASRLGAERVEVLVRDRSRADAAARIMQKLGLNVSVGDIGAPIREHVDVVVSTVPGVAIAGREVEIAHSGTSVFDAIYDPWPTRLASSSLDLGKTVVSGLDLLAHQAVGQIELMTGETVSPQVLLEAARDQLQSR